MKFFGIVMVVGVFAGLLAACAQSGQQPASNTATSAPAAPSEMAPPATGASDGAATLTVQPASVDGCAPDQPVAARLDWRSNVAKAQVLVTNPGEPTRLFSESGFTGSAKTGSWVVAGTKFELVDAATKHVLATQVISAGPCASSASVG